MNDKKNLIIAFIFACSTLLHENLSAVLTMSQYKPDSFFQKPYFTDNNFTNISTIFSGGFASQAYANDGNKVPYLQQFGSEDLLKKFTNPSLANNNIENVGQGALSGNFHVRELIISCYKNMDHGFFIEGATVIQDLLMNAISVTFIKTDIPLTDEQTQYLQNLQQQLPASIGESGMFTTAVYAGYNTSFSNFSHLDFVDAMIKIGFTSPQAMTANNTSILQFPFQENYNFGYPIIAAASLGVLDWITLGCHGAIIPWQSATQTIAMNNTNSNNTILLKESGLAIIQRGPLVVGSLYFEADHFHNGLSASIAYSYTKNYASTITPLDQNQFPQDIVNLSPQLKSWSLGSIYMQFDIDFACQAQPNAPVFTIFYNTPVLGNLCPKTTIFGGSCSLQISYGF